MINKVVAGLMGLMAGAHAAHAGDRHIAVVQSLTGPAAFIGANFAEGAKMAAEDLNAANYFGDGNKLTIEVLDDATDRTQTLSLMTRLAADGKTLVVLGPTSGAVALSAASIANERSIPMITVTSAMTVVENGPWSYILTKPADALMQDLTAFAAEKVGVKRCAVMGIKDIDAYVELQNEFEKQIRERGVEVVSVDGVAGTDTDFSALATRVASNQQDCVFISGPAALGANMITQLKQAGLDPETKIFGHNGFGGPVLIEKGGAAVDGVYLTGNWAPGGSTNDAAKSFNDKFAAKNGFEPDNWHALGYSGMLAMAAAVKNAGDNPTRESVRDAMNALKDVPIISGRGTFGISTEDRTPLLDTNILTVRDGKFVSAE